jgi:hypothetical protein
MVCAVQAVQIFLAHHNSCTGKFSHKTLHNHQFWGSHIGAAELSSFNNVTLCHCVSSLRCCGGVYSLHLQKQEVQEDREYDPFVSHSKMSVTAHQFTLCHIPKCQWLLTNLHCVTFQNVGDCSPIYTVSHSKMSVTAHQMTWCHIPKCWWLLTNWHGVMFQNVGDCSLIYTVSHCKMSVTAHQMTRCHIPKCRWLLTKWHCVTFQKSTFFI